MFFRLRQGIEAHHAPLWTVGVSALCLLTLNACKTTEPATPSQAQPLAAEGPRDSRGCVEAIASNSQYEMLRDKLYLGAGSEVRPSHLQSAKKPDPGEIGLLRAIHADLQGCRAIALTETSQPAERQSLVTAHGAEDKVWAEAFAGRLTWAKLNEQRRAIVMTQRARLNLPSASPKNELPVAKYDFNTIDYGYKVLPQFSRSAEDDGGVRVTGSPGRSSYCDRMSNSAYCSNRR